MAARRARVKAATGISAGQFSNDSSVLFLRFMDL